MNVQVWLDWRALPAGWSALTYQVGAPAEREGVVRLRSSIAHESGLAEGLPGEPQKALTAVHESVTMMNRTLMFWPANTDRCIVVEVRPLERPPKTAWC